MTIDRDLLNEYLLDCGLPWEKVTQMTNVEALQTVDHYEKILTKDYNYDAD